MEIPKAFISYSHDNLAHKKWVLELAIRLRNNGIDAIVDQFELQPGDDIPHFMETHLASATKILMICTEAYVEKANSGQGGVGYEKMIITANLMKRIDENKIIPVIRQVGKNDVPTFLKSKLYINFSKNDEFEFCFDELVRTIHNTTLFEKPPIGNKPFQSIKKEQLDGDLELIKKIMHLSVDDYNSQDNPSIRYITFVDIKKKLNISIMLAEFIVKKIANLGYLEYTNIDDKIRITEAGKLYAYENGFLNPK